MLHRSALALCPTGHPDRHSSLYELAWCLLNRNRRQRTLPDLEEAITLERAALSLHAEGHPDRWRSLHALAVSLKDRYNEQGNMADLEESITLGQAALELCSPSHSDHDFSLNHLGNMLRRRFLKLGVDTDLKEAISLLRSALDLRPEGHHSRSYTLHELALCFSDRYEKQASIVDLEEAVTLGRAALELRPPGHINRAWSLSSLGGYIWYRFLKLGSNADLGEAISLHRSALDLRPAGHPDRKNSLNNLVKCLSFPSKSLEATFDLEELITLHQTILDLYPPDQYDHTVSMDKLLLHIRQRAQTFGIKATLEECIAVGRSALALPDTGNPSQPTCIHRLVSELQNGFCNNEIISDVREAHPDHATVLHNLHAYIKDMIDKGDVAMDVDGIVGIAQAAYRLHPPYHSCHVTSLVATLATFHRRRFQLRGAISDLDMAMMLYREVLEAHQSKNPTNAQHMHELAWCLWKRSARLSTGNDLDDAIKFEQAALMLYPQGHPDRAESLGSLADYQQTKISRKSAPPRLVHHPTLTSNPAIEEVVGNIVFESLKAFPPRLVDTHTGTLCT